MTFSQEIFECVRDEISNRIDDGVIECMTAKARADAPVGETMELRNSISGSKVGKLSVEMVATAEHAAYQDGGRTTPFTITPTKPHGILTDGKNFFAQGPVTHPGYTKHTGWWSDAPWDQRWAECLSEVLS